MPIEINGTEYVFNVVENGELVQHDAQLGDGTVLWSSDGSDDGGDSGGDASGGTENQYYWTAEDYSVGDIPSEWETTNATIEIAEDSTGSKYLDVTAPSDTRSFLEFTPIATTEDGEVWVRWLTNEWVDAWAFLRGQSLDTPDSVSMTRTNYAPVNDNDGLAEFDEGVYRAIDSQALTTPANSIGQIRGSFSGDTLQGRWWTDGSAEPSTWDLTGTTNVTGSGASGIGHWTGSELRIYEFGVGTSGDSAPTNPV